MAATMKKPSKSTVAARKSARPKATAKSPASNKPAVKKVPKVSPTKGKTIDWYVSNLTGWQHTALTKLYEIVRKAAPAATSAMKWGQPVFESNGPFAWMKAFGRHVSLGFWRGAQLTDPAGRLEGDGDRMRHLKYTTAEAIDAAVIQSFVRQAIELNRLEGNPAMRR